MWSTRGKYAGTAGIPRDEEWSPGQDVVVSGTRAVGRGKVPLGPWRFPPCHGAAAVAGVHTETGDVVRTGSPARRGSLTVTRDVSCDRDCTPSFL